VSSIDPQQIIKFHRELFSEFLDSAGFLYEQRSALLDRAGFKWTDIQSVEDRIELFLDGLVVGGDEALAVCANATTATPGELHVACRILLRQNQLEKLLHVLSEADEAGPEARRAAADALGLETADGWQKSLVQAAMRSGKAASVVVRFAGYARLPVRGWLLRLVEKGVALAPALWALGRLPADPASLAIMRPCLDHADMAVKASAALALLRLRDQTTLDTCLRALERGETWAALPVALSGGPGSMPRLFALVENGAAGSVEVVEAISVLGAVGGVELLLKAVAEKTSSAAAAAGLFRLTGVDVPQPAERAGDDELFPDELEARNANPAPPSEVELASRWCAFWEQNHAHFDPKTRWIFGKPASAAALVECLEAPTMPRRHRDLAYDELAIRFGATQAFETDFPVVEQKRALVALEAFASACSPKRI